MISTDDLLLTLDNRILMKTINSYGVDPNNSYRWNVYRASDSDDRLIVNTGWHTFWAHEILQDFIRNKGFRCIYRFSNIPHLTDALYCRFGVLQLDGVGNILHARKRKKVLSKFGIFFMKMMMRIRYVLRQMLP